MHQWQSSPNLFVFSDESVDERGITHRRSMLVTGAVFQGGTDTGQPACAISRPRFRLQLLAARRGLGRLERGIRQHTNRARSRCGRNTTRGCVSGSDVDSGLWFLLCGRRRS
jgi:hypothetical protein